MASTSITRTSWTRLLALFTFASFIETVFYGQLGAFTPLYLPALGVALNQVIFLTGIAGSLRAIVGLPFLPLWGALASATSASQSSSAPS